MGTPDKNMPTKTEPLCQVCGEGLEGQDVVLCSRCKTAHHLECWRYNKGCSVFGCGCRTSQKPHEPLIIRPGEAFAITSPLYRGPWSETLWTMAIVATAISLPLALSTNTTLIIGLAFALFGAVITGGLTHASLLKQRIAIDPDRGMIDRSLLLLGREMTKEKDWLARDDIAEIHLHKALTQSEQRSRLKYSLHALTTRGTRVPLMMKFIDPGVESDEAIRLWAERLADFADCTVREFESESPPSPEEIEEALEARRIEESPLALEAGKEETKKKME